MITDRSPDDVFSASEVQNDDKKKAWDNGGVRERDHAVYMWKLCLQTRCVRAPSLAVRKSIVAVERRASEVHFTLDIRGAGRYLALVRQNERGVRGSSPGKF